MEAAGAAIHPNNGTDIVLESRPLYPSAWIHPVLPPIARWYKDYNAHKVVKEVYD